MKKSVYDEYVKIYNEEFGEYKHAYEEKVRGIRQPNARIILI